MTEVIKIYSFSPSLDDYHLREAVIDSSIEFNALEASLTEDLLFALANAGCSSFIVPASEVSSVVTFPDA